MPTCAICGGDSATAYLKAGLHPLVKCRTCGLIYVSNFRTDPAVYSGADYFTRENEYVRRWDEFCALFEPLVGKIRRFKPGGTLLDVGAGVGTLMHVASLNGFDVKGVEVSAWASGYARNERGLDVFPGQLDEARFQDGAFDVVVANHVLEHVPDPKGLLTEIRRVLKNNGLLVIGVPNAGSIPARLLRARWASLRPEQHIWHFTPATLGALMRMAGFDVVYWEAKENHPVAGWGAIALIRRAMNAVSVRTNMSEAMLFFAQKNAGAKA